MGAEKAENAPVANGRYVISNAKFSENVISINGQNATLGTYVGAKNQMFDISIWEPDIIKFYRFNQENLWMWQMHRVNQAQICGNIHGTEVTLNFGSLSLIRMEVIT